MTLVACGHMSLADETEEDVACGLNITQYALEMLFKGYQLSVEL